MTRAAAYCRVSTDMSDQQNSFESQKRFFQSYIESKPDWTLVGIYTDEGITGTSTAGRAGFLKLIDDAYAGKIDIVLTKEVSRFSRNILDAVAYTRALKSLGVAVVFLSDGISTLDPDAELRLGIMAAVAQEESRKTSERVKWGQQRRMERGVVFGPSLLGYEVHNGKISLEPRGAETVRMIFEMYLRERMGIRAIASELTRRGVGTRSGNNRWSGATILKILRNEKYCGDLVQRKTVTTDFLTHKKKKNRGDAELVTIRDNHEAIVDRETWEAVQKELLRRASKSEARGEESQTLLQQQRTAATALEAPYCIPDQMHPSPHGSRYALSGNIVCATCRTVFYSRVRKRSDGTTYRVWTRRCMCESVPHQVREDAVASCIRRFVGALDAELLLSGFMSNIRRASAGADEAASLRSEMEKAERKAVKLADAYITGDIGRDAYLELKAKYAAAVLKLQERLQMLDSSEDGNTFSLMENIAASAAAGREEDDAFYLGLVDRAEAGTDRIIKIILRGVNGTPLCVS